MESSVQFPLHDMIWKGGIPTKVRLFAWLAVIKRVNTCDMLQARHPGMSISPSWCCLCKGAAEDIDHILLHCRFAREIWLRIFRLFHCVGAVPKTWADFLVIKWKFRKSDKRLKFLWRYSTMATMWQIWLERNRRIFEGKYKTDEDIWSYIKNQIVLWARASKVLDLSDSFLFGLDCFSFLSDA